MLQNCTATVLMIELECLENCTATVWKKLPRPARIMATMAGEPVYVQKAQ